MTPGAMAAETRAETRRAPGRLGPVVLWSCLLLAVVLRLAVFPQALSPVETDEVGYLTDGLQIIEGMTPAHKYAPSAPLAWFGTIYAGIDTLATWAKGGPELAGFPGLLKPVAALNTALFHLYADVGTMRLVAVSLIVLLSLLSVAAMCRLGEAVSGARGQAMTGLLAASAAICVELSVQTRPYAIAWAFGLMALAAAGSGRGRGHAGSAGLWLGLAIGSHIDMARVAPLVLLLLWWRSRDGRPPWRDFAVAIAATIVTFLLVAPWYTLHLIDNLRQILSVRFLPAEQSLPSWLPWWEGGLLLTVVFTSVGLLLAGLRRRWPELLAGLWLSLNAVAALRLPSHGLHHDGAVIVASIALAPLALESLRDLIPPARWSGATAILFLVAVGPTVWAGINFALAASRSDTQDDVVGWIEHNVPAGARVYLETIEGVVVPLPTAEAADRLWADVAAPDAWIPKYIHDTQRFDLGGARPLAVMSDDRMSADRGNRRRYYILGTPLEPQRPRYDLWLVSEGSFYDASPAAAIDRLCRDGGVYVHRGLPLAALPPPAAVWRRAKPELSAAVYSVRPGQCAGGQ